MTEVMAALSEVYPGIPLPVERMGSSHRLFQTMPMAWFGDDDPILILAYDDDGLVLAEPKLCWPHPNIPSWDFSARFTIPQEWTKAMTAEQRETLKGEARKIGETRLAKYADCSACGERCMPEHLHHDSASGRLFCDSCAHEILGVIH